MMVRLLVLPLALTYDPGGGNVTAGIIVLVVGLGSVAGVLTETAFTGGGKRSTAAAIAVGLRTAINPSSCRKRILLLCRSRVIHGQRSC